MSRVEARAERERWKQFWTAKVALPGFISESLEQFVPKYGECPLSQNTVEVVRDKANDRITIRYGLNRTANIYAKVYFDKNLTLRAYQWLRHLWEKGFGETSEQQVPEPIGLIPGDGLLLMHAVNGTPLSEILYQSSLPRAVYLIRATAQWLARLHATEVPHLQVEPPCEALEVMKTAALLAKVAAAHPERAPLLLELTHEWKTLAPATNLPVRLVPVHGQFRPGHVFVEGRKVAVIDLDDFKLSDPAKDVARFIHAMLKTSIEMQQDFSRTAFLADEFVGAYNAFAPGNLANLRYYVSLYSLKELGKVVKSEKIGDGRRDLIEGLYLGGFKKCLRSNPTLCFAA